MSEPASNTPAAEPAELAPNGSAGLGFGTAPVFLAAISTILGAVMFLRFGYAVGHLGALGAIAVIFLGHLVTIPTAMAVAEIATNRRVEGGGEYFMISRSFGTTIGGTIGVSLYLSQAVSVAFYMIAFAEAFRGPLGHFAALYNFPADPRLVSVPATVLLVLLMLTKGANLGVRALWAVVTILVISLGAFFLGGGTEAGAASETPLTAHIPAADPFILVFAICFPAFTGMTAGVGLSGDLKNPRRSIPLGTLSATLVGMATYVAIVLKLAGSATPAELAGEQLIMARIALWGPIIPIGLAAATVSSALGSIMIAPRTLQALAKDHILPNPQVNAALASGRGKANEPLNATLLTGVLAFVFVLAGDVDFVAQLISMFFMVTYGAICGISFLEHFAGNPSYRPTFRSRWYISLLGGFSCFMMMFQMQPGYAVLALLLMGAVYMGLRYSQKGERDLTAILQGVMFQLTRNLHIAVQRGRAEDRIQEWRPSVVTLTTRSEERLAHFDLLRWLCHRHGFGQFIHLVTGQFSSDSERYANQIRQRLINRGAVSAAGIYVDTIVAPSYDSALMEVVQRPGVSGMPNNTVLFEFSRNNPDEIEDFRAGLLRVADLRFNTLVLRSSNLHFGYHRTIHVWLTRDDYTSAPLMILLAYIIVGHPDWKDADISVFACFPRTALQEERKKLVSLITEGRLPIPEHRLRAVPYDDDYTLERAMSRHSANADLVVLGIRREEIAGDLSKTLRFAEGINDLLFVCAAVEISIS